MFDHFIMNLSLVKNVINVVKEIQYFEVAQYTPMHTNVVVLTSTFFSEPRYRHVGIINTYERTLIFMNYECMHPYRFYY